MVALKTENCSIAQKEDRNGQAEDLQDENAKKASTPVKGYIHRNSLLTDLMEINHVRTVYHIGVAMGALLVINTALYYIADPETFHKDMEIVQWAAGKWHIFAIGWSVLMVTCAFVHQGFCFWVLHRQKVPSMISDFVFVVSFLCIGILMFTLTPYFIFKTELGPMTACSLLGEQVRMYMKLHSFVVENYSKVRRLSTKKDEVSKKDLCPSFSHFMYFMFAPVFIYRDSYPRTKTRNWSFVVANFFKVFACIAVAYCMFLRFNVAVFSQVGFRTFTLPELVLILNGCTIVGSIMMFLLFYTVLHAWLNAFAELLRFGDRMFYKDWWNSTTFSQYYRMWNYVVYDWIYTYVYVHLTALGVNKSLAMVTVLFTSSVIHDYVICVALGYFFPILGFIYSTVGFLVTVVTKNRKSRSWNIFLWATLFSGWGILIFSFTMEWYARKNCPSPLEGFLQHIVPRSFFCPLLTPSGKEL